MKMSTLSMLSFLLLLVFQSKIDAQTEYDFKYKKGEIEVSTTMGLFPTFVGIDAKQSLIPVSIGFQYQLLDKLSVGVIMEYAESEFYHSLLENTLLSSNKFINKYTLTGVRFGGHFQKGRTLMYGGGMLAYGFSKISNSDKGEEWVKGDVRVRRRANSLLYTGFIGIKHLCTENLSFFGELGYGVSLVKMGVAYRLIRK